MRQARHKTPPKVLPILLASLITRLRCLAPPCRRSPQPPVQKPTLLYPKCVPFLGPCFMHLVRKLLIGARDTKRGSLIGKRNGASRAPWSRANQFVAGVRWSIVLSVVGAVTSAGQGASARASHRAEPALTARAIRAMRAPVVDGRDDDAVWGAAPPITAFREWQPTEGQEPRFRTEARIAYDAGNLYVFIRAYDPHPDSIIRILERRDTRTPSDMLWVMVDSYHSHRTGYEFGVNAAGVKLDEAIYNDGTEDVAWDAVWDVATRIDSLGWTAEFRIPMSQLHYEKGRVHTFGIAVDRDIYRYNERVSWPMLSPAKAGLVSQFGDLTGLTNLEAPRRIEAEPYVVMKNAPTVSNDAVGRASNATIGGDLKIRGASNLTVDATVNPDFGQVESDPSVLNLTAFETFFDERRPFFVTGRGLFEFDVDCNQVNCNGEGLYYSRRIGRTPELARAYGDTTPLVPTTILGATKLIARTPGGFSIGVLDAVTERASMGVDTTTEPGTNYGLVRITQDMGNGAGTVGGELTAVTRQADRYSSPHLARKAYAGAVDFRHRFFSNTYEVSGSLDASRVEGTPAALSAIQTDAVHDYQRPDAGLPLDSSRTVLAGDAEELKIDKVGGAHLIGETAYQRRSPGFEVNDLGFLQRADQQSWSTWVGLFDRARRRFTDLATWQFNWVQSWTTNGLPLNRWFNTNVQLQFRNHMQWAMGSNWGGIGATFDDRSARGGPAIRQSSYVAPYANFHGDDRRSLMPVMFVNYSRTTADGSWSLTLRPEVDLKLWRRFSSSVGLNWTRAVTSNQWYNNYTDTSGVTHYTFARLAQSTVAATMRVNYTFTPNISLQVYAQPFIAKGGYGDVRQLSATPRARQVADRYAAFGDTSVTTNAGGFDFRAFQSNVVFRWEYRPGSTLFVVWNEGRQGSTGLVGGNELTGDDVRGLFSLHPADTFLVKGTYWLNL